MPRTRYEMDDQNLGRVGELFLFFLPPSFSACSVGTGGSVSYRGGVAGFGGDSPPRAERIAAFNEEPRSVQFGTIGRWVGGEGSLHKIHVKVKRCQIGVVGWQTTTYPD